VRRARGAGPGLLVRRSGNRAFVYSVRSGRVRAVAVTTGRLVADRRALSLAMRRVLRAEADNRPRTFVPAEAQATRRMLGRTLAGSGDRKVDAKLALICSLNL